MNARASKIAFSLPIALLLLILCVDATDAGTLIWTNTLGGVWENAVNWSPNQVPAAGDDVVVTNAGIYTVTNSSIVSLDSLLLGGMIGAQTLTGGTLSFTNACLVASNGVLNWSGGDLDGSLTAAQGGTLTLSNTIYFAYNNYTDAYTNTARLTNYGTVIWAGAITAEPNSQGAGGGIIYNAGLWESVADNTMNPSYEYAGTNSYFINTGTLEKTGGTGTGATTINWNFENEGGTISTPVDSFTMNNWIGNGMINGNATFSGGIIRGAIGSNAAVALLGGDLEGALTVMQGGTLTLSNTVDFAYNNYTDGYTNTATLTNYGTVIWAGAINAEPNSQGAGGGIIYNAGLWESAADNTMNPGYEYSGTNSYFINTGTLEKIGGTGTGATTINWNFENEGGTINTPVDSFTMDNWIGNGLINGSATFSGGIISGAIASNAAVTLLGADLEGSLTVAQGGTLTLSNTIFFAYGNYADAYSNTATLTNYGTVIWAGAINAEPNSQGGGGGIIYNAGLWESVGDNAMNRSYEYNGTNSYFINTGTLEKIGGTGTGATTINWNFENEGGTINSPVDSFTMDNWIGNGLINGSATFSGGAISGTIASNAVVTWLGADLEGSLTVAQGGTLTLSNTIFFAYNNYADGYTNTATLTNYGTVIWAGAIDAEPNAQGGGGGIIYNAGLWESVADNAMNPGYEYNGTNSYFINTGALEKIGGAGTSTISWNFLNNGGILGAQTNTLSLAGNYDLTGGALNFGINSPGNNGTINLAGSPAALTGALSVNLNNDYVPAAGSSFPVLTFTSSIGAFTNFSSLPGQIWQTNYNATSFVLTYLGQMVWATPTNITYGAALSASQLDASTVPAVAGTFSYDPAAGTVLDSGAGQWLTAVFTPSSPGGVPASLQVPLTALQAPLGLTAINQTKTYGQTFSFDGTEFAPSGLVNGDAVTSASLASAGAISNALVSGSPYAITISHALGDAGLTNYIITYTNGVLIVNRAGLTVTANSASRPYGAANPVFSASYSGFVNGETASVLSGAPALATSATPASGIGNYAIMPALGSLTAANYTFGPFINGTLTINPAPLTVASGLAANNKFYDRTTTASLSFSNVALSNVFNGDMVSLNTNSYAANFASAGVGSGLSVTVTGLALNGARATNYTLTQPTGLTASIIVPSLQIQFSFPNILLSWPANASVFMLNGTSNLASAISWMPVTNGITVSGTNNNLTANASGGNQFYKLIAP